MTKRVGFFGGFCGGAQKSERGAQIFCAGAQVLLRTCARGFDGWFCGKGRVGRGWRDEREIRGGDAQGFFAGHWGGGRGKGSKRCKRGKRVWGHAQCSSIY